MGRRERKKPKRLAEKLKQVREGLALSQTAMVRRLGFEGDITKSEISDFEHGRYEPNLLVLLAYSEAANVSLEILVRDSLDLPKELPVPKKSKGSSQLPKTSKKSL
jgi:transcriptional regulator with XRE-family HTH domain